MYTPRLARIADESPQKVQKRNEVRVIKGSAPLLMLPLFLCAWGFLTCQLAFGQPANRGIDNGSGPYFFRDQPFGSDLVFNPVSWIINDSFDTIQLGVHERRLSRRDYRTDVANLWDNLSRPIDVIDEFGWRNFVSQEVFPLSFGTETALWAPNYLLHVVGGGISYRLLFEYYESKGIGSPGIASLTTVILERFLNELNENNGRTGLNVDPIADVFIFDPASILLFQSERVQRFFGSTLQASVWGKQPSLVFPRAELHNVGQYYALKWRPSSWEKYSLFHHFGMGALGGLSRDLNNGHAVSVGIGFKSSQLRTVDPLKGTQTIVAAPSIGFFYDRNHSLLASLQISDAFDKIVELNVYPGLFPLKGTGLWISSTREGRVDVGLSTRLGIGVGGRFF